MVAGAHDLDLDALRARVAARRLEVEALRRAHPVAELLRYLPGQVGRLDAAGKLTDVGFTELRPSPVGCEAFDYIPTAQRAEVRAIHARVIATGQAETFETDVTFPDGATRQYLTRYAPGGPGADGITYVALEVTELKRTHEALRDRTAETKTVMLATGMGSFSYDATSDAWRLDERLRLSLGIDPRTLTQALEAVHPEDRMRAAESLRRAISSGDAQEEELRIVGVDGQVRWFLMRGRSVGPGRVIGGVLEITGERRLRAELQRARSAEAMGRFAAGIAHNFNNMLAAVLARLDFVLRDAGAELRPGLLAAIDAGTAAAATVRDLLRLGRQGIVGRREPVELGGLVRRCLELARFAYACGIEPLVATPGVPMVFVDEGALERFLLELIVRFGGRGIRLHALTLEAVAGDLGDACACLRISSDAVLIDATEARTLELALAGIADARLALGLNADGSRSLALIFVGHRPAVPASEDRRLLVVDDDAPVRQAIHSVLADAGYPVRSAGDGHAALAALALEPAALVLLDLSMPGLAGLELIAELRARVPRARILLFSGGEAPEAVLREADGFLAKPVRIDELLDAVHDMLAGGG